MRLSNQTVVTSSGSKFRSKNIRLATSDLAGNHGARSTCRTLGIARLNGFEIPVRRGARGVWFQLSPGVRYDAHGVGYNDFSW